MVERLTAEAGALSRDIRALREVPSEEWDSNHADELARLVRRASVIAGARAGLSWTLADLEGEVFLALVQAGE